MRQTYVNPDDRSQKWSGRGRKPNWLKAKLANGAKLADFVDMQVWKPKTTFLR